MLAFAPAMIERRLLYLLLVLVFLLLLMGGLVHNTGSSLACPDWPLCYGSLLPEMTGGIAIEHSHRLVATAVGLMTVILALLIWKRRKGDRELRQMAMAAVVLVVVQGLLGGITVLYQLPPLVSISHLAISIVFFSLLVVMGWKTKDPLPRWEGMKGRVVTGSPSPLPSPLEGGGRIQLYLLITTGLVYLQILLGAVVRHGGLGIVCPDLPFCYGKIWPEGSLYQGHMAHRFGGIIIALFVLAIPFVLRRGNRPVTPTGGIIRWFIFAGIILVLIQIILGAACILTVLGVASVTAHLGVAVLLMGTMVSLVCLTSRGRPPQADAPY